MLPFLLDALTETTETLFSENLKITIKHFMDTSTQRNSTTCRDALGSFH